MGRIVVLFLKWFGILFSILPRGFQLFLGKCLGAFFRLIKLRQKIVRQNLELAYPGDQSMRNQVEKESYEALGNLVLEVPMVLGAMPRFIKRNVELRGHENWLDAKSCGKGVIFLSSHLGNWEVMAAAGAYLGKMDLMLVTKQLKPDWLHDAIEKGRGRYGVTAAYEPRTFGKVLKHLHKNGTVGFVLDQYAGPPVGVRVPLFGVPVGTGIAVAMLAKRTGAVVLPVQNYREKNGRWVVDIGKAMTWKADPDAHYELAYNTAEYVQDIEKKVYAHPGQWLWIHRRFKGDLGPLREGEWTEGRNRV